MKSSKAVFCLACIFMTSCWLRARSGAVREGPRQVQAFTQAFYNWYLPTAIKEGSTPAWDFVLKQRPSAFTYRLITALREDSAAQAKAAGMIVGLDFDPFLNTQDPCARYVTGEVTQKGKSFWVPIYAVCSGKRNRSPDVIAEVVRGHGAWEFANFHYPDTPPGDLLSILTKLRQARAQGAK